MAITDNLMAWWDLSESSGTRNDSVGTNHMAASASSPTGVSDGPGGHAASHFVRASSQALSCTPNASIKPSSTDFTLTCWVRKTTNNDFQGFVSYGTATGPTRSIILLAIASTDTPANGVACQVYSDGTSGGGPLGDITLNTATWYWLLMQYTFSSSNLEISINNGTLSGSTRTDNFAPAAAWGFGWREELTQHNLNGDLAMCGFWKRLLTAPEKALLYNSGNGKNYAELIGPTMNIADSLTVGESITPNLIHMPKGFN